jgi:hypothetical protein
MYTRSTISASVTPIILGGTPMAYKTAAHLFFRYGLISNIFATSQTLASRLVFFTRFNPLPESRNDCFALMSLERFYVEQGESTYLLIPADRDQEDFVKRNSDALETKFILRRPKDVMCDGDIFPLAPKKGF